MSNNYIVQKNVDKIRRKNYTYFLNPGLLQEIRYYLKGNEYNIYEVYPDCDKVILYTKEIPIVRLIAIDSVYPLKHSDILGSLFGLNIEDEIFGDIIVDNGNYYFYVVDEIFDFIMNNLQTIGKYKIKLREIDIDYLKDYRRKYEECILNVSSLRIDNVVSKIIGTSRDKFREKIKNREITKKYVALVRGVIKENHATIDMPIGRSTSDRKKMAVNRNGKNAVTHIKVLKRYDKYTLVEVNIETGRVEGTAVNIKAEQFTKHPTTNIELLGFQIPLWKEVKELVTNAAKEIPQLKLIGWDVAIAKDGPCLIEANQFPGHDLYSMIKTPNNIGMVKVFDNAIKVNK